ncbi:biotin-dependent carboxyltransferase family protein [Gammaproteobacteria bacterium AS21]
MIEVIMAGMLTSVQDHGRKGYRQIGVGLSGAMDDFALSVANLLLGNPNEAAALEITLGGCALKFKSDTTIALTGTDMKATLDGHPIPSWWAVSVKADQILKMAIAPKGLRSYLAIAGGIDVPLIMCSRSTDLKAGFGGFNGRALKAGDYVKVFTSHQQYYLKQGFGISRRLQNESKDSNVVVRILAAAQWNDFSKEAQCLFLNSPWLVTPQSNRLGYCLSGPVIVAQKQQELLSHGILPGCVQMPPSGQPVIQLNDANTCGGYPKLGVVIEADLRKLAQVRPGESISFQLCTQQQAVQARTQLQEQLTSLKLQAESMRKRLSDPLF